MNIKISTLVSGNHKSVFEKFDRDLFMALKPPLINLDLEIFDGCTKGDKVEMSLGILGIKQSWKSLITDNGTSEEGSFFVDEGVLLPPPLKEWKHRHILENVGETQTMIIDDIYYSSGSVVLDALMYPILYLQFWYRKPVYKSYFK